MNPDSEEQYIVRARGLPWSATAEKCGRLLLRLVLFVCVMLLYSCHYFVNMKTVVLFSMSDLINNLALF